MSDLRAIGFAEVRGRLTGNRLTVYDALINGGPQTGSELARRMGWSVLSVRPRLSELADLCHAQATGKRRDSEHEFRALSASEAEALHATKPATLPPGSSATSEHWRKEAIEGRSGPGGSALDAQTMPNGDRKGVALFIPAPLPVSNHPDLGKSTTKQHQTGFLFE